MFCWVYLSKYIPNRFHSISSSPLSAGGHMAGWGPGTASSLGFLLPLCLPGHPISTEQPCCSSCKIWVIPQLKSFHWLLIRFIKIQTLSRGTTESDLCRSLVSHFNTWSLAYSLAMSSGSLLSRSHFPLKCGCLIPSPHQISAPRSHS